MANFNINDLTAIGTIADADLFEVEQVGINLKATGAQIKTYLQWDKILKRCADVAMSSNSLATLTSATGSGTSGAIKKNDMFYNTASSTTLKCPDGVTLIFAGTWITALQDTPTLIGHFSFVPSTL